MDITMEGIYPALSVILSLSGTFLMESNWNAQEQQTEMKHESAGLTDEFK